MVMKMVAKKQFTKTLKLIKKLEYVVRNKDYIDIINKKVSSSGHSGRIYLPPEYVGKEVIVIICQ